MVPAYLRPFALFVYVCGFGGGKRDLRSYMERQRGELITSGVKNVCECAKGANAVINHVGKIFTATAPERLSLVLLLKS